MPAPDTSLLNFITDEHLRQSLASDYAEMEDCLKNKNLKAVHVLAGSIIETVLCDYILATNPNGRKAESILDMGLSALIRECKGSIISDRTASLCYVVTDYRNLIHPGRSRRLNDIVTPESATVANALVRMVIDEVMEKRKETYGPTSEQVIDKIVSDRKTSFAVLPALLKAMNEKEKFRLICFASVGSGRKPRSG